MNLNALLDEPMVLWTSVLLSIGIGWIATRIGLYETLVHTVNALISIYLSLFLTPYVVTHVPSTTGISGGLPLTLATLAGGSFVILSGVSYFMFTGQFKVRFPKLLDVLLSGILGCCTGFLLVSMLCLILSVLPYRMTGTLFGESQIEAHTRVLCHCCDSLQRIVGRQGIPVRTQTLINWMVEKKDQLQDQSSSQTDPNAPIRTPVPPIPNS